MKYRILAATALGLLMTAPHYAQAQDARSLSREATTIEERNAYQYEFNRDEQCQGYHWGVKRLGLEDPCGKDEEEKSITVDKVNVLSEYVVYFGFDKSDIRESDKAILRDAARDITRYNPREVRVAGYTDTRGSMAYNEALSAKRADNVSDFLTDMGVSNFVVDEKAMGETNLAVPTGDEVKNQRNRRVVIQFIR